MSSPVKREDLLNQRDGWIPSGYVQLRRRITAQDFEGDFVVFILGFVGATELQELWAWAKRNGCEGFPIDSFAMMDGIDLQRTEKVAAICPDHNCAMKPSQKPEQMFCPKKTGGSYCKRIAKRSPSGGWHVV